MKANDKISEFMQEHFAEQLQKEGFVSYQNNMRHWYRLMDESVLQMVIMDHHRRYTGEIHLLYGNVPLYIPFPFPYQHKIDPNTYFDILDDAGACYKREVSHNFDIIYDPLNKRYMNQYNRFEQICVGAFREIIWPSFHTICNLKTCHQLWWEKLQEKYKDADRQPYYSIERGIWELIYGHHKAELTNYIQSSYAEQCKIWGESEFKTYLPKSWRELHRVYYDYAKRIIHDSETDNWDDLDLLLQENMQQMRELVRKKLKL